MNPQPTPARRAWPTLLAWLVILGVVGFILVRQARRPGGDLAASLVALQVQSRLVVGLNSVGFPETARAYEQVESSVPEDDYSQRLRLAILAGELNGPTDAWCALEQLERDRKAGDI